MNLYSFSISQNIDLNLNCPSSIKTTEISYFNGVSIVASIHFAL